MIASRLKSLPAPSLEQTGTIWDKVQQLLAASCRHRHLTQPFSAVSSNRLHSDLNEGGAYRGANRDFTSSVSIAAGTLRTIGLRCG